MSLDYEESAFFHQLQQLMPLPTPWSLSFSPTDEGFIERLDMLEDAEGKLANKEIYRILRETLKPGKIKEKREFVVAGIPLNRPAIKKMLEDLSDKLIHVAFRYFALAMLAKERAVRLERATASVRSQRFHETEEDKERRAQMFSTNMTEFAKHLKENPDVIEIWKILAKSLKSSIGKEYLAKAAESVYNRDVDCNIRIRRELATILIEYGALAAAEKVLDGAALDPFA